MPIRKVPFIEGEFYHVYNRGVNKRRIFLNVSDYRKMITTIEYYSFTHHRIKLSDYLALSPSIQNDYYKRLNQKSIEIISFVLMPNHYHFLLKQTAEKGISNFISLLQNSYTKYFNVRHVRIGHLFQGQFKSVQISNNDQLLHISRYIHLNPLTSLVTKSLAELENYPWSTYPMYIDPNKKSTLINPQPILEQFGSIERYKEFVSDQAAYQRELEFIKHHTLED